MDGYIFREYRNKMVGRSLCILGICLEEIVIFGFSVIDWMDIKIIIYFSGLVYILYLCIKWLYEFLKVLLYKE